MQVDILVRKVPGSVGANNPGQECHLYYYRSAWCGKLACPSPAGVWSVVSGVAVRRQDARGSHSPAARAGSTAHWPTPRPRRPPAARPPPAAPGRSRRTCASTTPCKVRDMSLVRFQPWQAFTHTHTVSDHVSLIHSEQNVGNTGSTWPTPTAIERTDPSPPPGPENRIGKS